MNCIVPTSVFLRIIDFLQQDRSFDVVFEHYIEQQEALSSSLVICAGFLAGCSSGNNSTEPELILKHYNPISSIEEATMNKYLGSGQAAAFAKNEGLYLVGRIFPECTGWFTAIGQKRSFRPAALFLFDNCNPLS